MKKGIFRIVVFLPILICILIYTNNVFKFKYSEGISQFNQFYLQDKNSIDVLILGSSHAFVNYNNGSFYKEYGIASYNLGASMQTMWNSYYDLQEALKTQTPELIILEGHGITFDFDYLYTSGAIKNIYGMKWSLNKIKDIFASVDSDHRFEYLLEYTQYHMRYKELSKGDFSDPYGQMNMEYNWYGDSWKGQYLFNTFTPLSIEDVSTIDEAIDLSDKSEKYYRKIIELAQEKNIPIIIIVAPCNVTEIEQKKYNMAHRIADEYGVEFINCNLSLNDIGLDLKRDFYDSGHMNVWGSKKYSEYIGEYIKDHYMISDRRGDAKYSSWQEQSDYIDRFIYNASVAQTGSYDEFFDCVNEQDYWIIMSLTGSCSTSDSTVRTMIQQFDGGLEINNRIWIVQDETVIWKNSKGQSEYYIITDSRDFYLKCKESDNECDVIIDNVKYDKVKNGMNIVVYDPYTNMIVDNVGIDIDNNYQLKR